MQIEGQNRDQIQFLSLNEIVSPQSIVRIIDVFVDHLDLKELKFKIKGSQNEGRPAYSASTLLKLYIYGYMHRVRSSRSLERECQTNVEAMWLVRGLKPSYKTISDFRKDNPRGMRKSFRKLNEILKGQDLFSDELVAVDGSKFKAQNSKKNNYNEKKINDHISYIEKQTEEYLKSMDEVDKKEGENEIKIEQQQGISEKLDHLWDRKKKYETLKEQINKAHKKGQTQISTIDPDARALPKKMNIVEVAYNTIITTEGKNKLITNFEVTNQHDTYALSKASRKAKRVLGIKGDEEMTVIADKGFDTGHQLKECHDHNIDTLVSPKKRISPQKSKAFNKEKFCYDTIKDSYTCPAGKELVTNGNWYKRGKGKLRKSYRVKHYKSKYSVCNQCEHRLACAGISNLSRSKGRYVERSEYQDYIDQNINQVKSRKNEYRKRQQLVEHPFGTIKRQWGYDYTLLKTIKKVEAEFSIIFLCYNLRRAITILGIEGLKKALKQGIKAILQLRTHIMHHVLKNESKFMMSVLQ